MSQIEIESQLVQSKFKNDADLEGRPHLATLKYSCPILLSPISGAAGLDLGSLATASEGRIKSRTTIAQKARKLEVN